ncbi:MAG: internalin [Ferruginibacter sp.]|nr:internalin [Ferruginibacter sp.]
MDVSAQLQANFTVDKQAGCSPLSIKFTNTTTGTTNATTWQWSFGNGNSSTLKDPGATYFTEKTYSVTLTANDGTASSTKTMDITVYKKPAVDFSVSTVKGCAPLPVSFTANASAGDGSISNYLWDFGDGATLQGSSFSSTQHTYSFAQVPPITLNVTNSYGCYATLTKNPVEVVVGVKASFTPSATRLCNAGESISFLNTSTGSGTLTYLWDFGDGKTATDPSPSHVFATSGSFVVTLTTTSSDGCSAQVKSAAINVANFVADFSIPSKICHTQYMSFTNKSTVPFDKAEWWIDNALYGTNYNGDLSTAFNSTGDHTVKLVMYYGTCSRTITKTVTVNALPPLNGFVASLQGVCGVPVTIQYKDTTPTAVAWSWQNSYYGNIFATTQNASYNYTSNGQEYVYLTVTNAAGCTSTIGKYINYAKPNIYIILSNSSNGNSQGCTGLSLSFKASFDTAIADYKWNFGDGASSTDKNPTHIFNKAGTYTVALDYTTNNGCKGVTYFNNVTVVDKPVVDITSLQGTVICGNTPVTLSATPSVSGWGYNWYFNDQYSGYYYGGSSIQHQFLYDTTYTIKVIASNSGCLDTVTKKDYLKVLPPFPHIQQVINTCNDTRGMVRFIENSNKALAWNWDFGDGNTTNYTAFKDTILHTYTKTGSYKAVLSITNAGCTVKDSIIVYVLLKQHPLLAATKTDACGSDIVNITLSGFESNPYNYNYNYYGIGRKEYGDLSICNGYLSSSAFYWQNSMTGTIESLQPGKNDLRLITSSYYFGCADTSNFIPLKIHGPEAGFRVAAHSGCFKDAVQFIDTSRKFGSTALIKWEWDFGDGKTQTLTTTGSTVHFYSTPGYFYIRLKVTDADGCSNQTAYYLHYVTVDGPKADFSASSYNVPPNTKVYFNNTSLFYNYNYNSSLQWLFSDGTTSTNPSPDFTYTTDGVFTVQLVTKNLTTGCTDTMRKTITVRKVNSVFTYRLSYINNNSCPPVIASFNSVSTNAVRVSWNFGDGGVAGDQRAVSHTYNKPGIYRVVHYSYDSNIGIDSTEDFIEVKGPYALLKADVFTGCGSLQVKLTADVKNANNYTWDFGDGTVVPTTDTFAVHTYLTPGIYVPALILKDAGGCSVISELPTKVIVDSLAATFRSSPAMICDSALSIFTPTVKSLSNTELQSPLQYTWIIGEGSRVDTLYSTSPSHYYTILGTHAVKLEVTTPFGCVQKFTDSVQVKQGVHATIAGPAKLCKGDVTSFSAIANQAATALQWKWDFQNGNSSDKQVPVAQQYNSIGLQQVSLTVSNGSCSETIYHPLMVNPLPVTGFIPAAPFVCKGSNVLLTATGGTLYQWTAAAPIINGNTAIATSSPVSSIFYFVKVTDLQGCSSNDSVLVKVIDPIKLTVSSPLFACEGNPVQLSASGADRYQWINNSTGISNTAIANPSALTGSSVVYTVAGFDSYHCFSDTAKVNVRISKLPLVDAGMSKEVIGGAEVTLTPSVTGAVNWLWSPADDLSCTTCLNPVSKPKSSLIYTLTAFNADGCKASDTIGLKLICASNLVYIPRAFTPNNDNLNDRFTIKGSGIKTIRSIHIYNRWGKLVFERKSIAINDRQNSWDGYYNGEAMPTGAYVYFIVAECEAGDVFEYRGTVMIVQ